MRIVSRNGVALAGALLLAGCTETPLTPMDPAADLLTSSSSGEATSYSGEATVVDATVWVPLVGAQNVRLVHTEIPSTGGAENDHLVEAELEDVGGLGLVQGSFRVLHASTVAQGSRSHSRASAADVDLTVAGYHITAEVLRAEAWAECREDGTAVVRGDSDIVNLTIDGQQIDVGTEPNQEITLVNEENQVTKIIINEQHGGAAADRGEKTVNALHVIVYSPTGEKLADVVISSAHADIECRGAPVCPLENDFITGGGWLELDGRKNFAIAGGIKNGFWGHLVYHDKAKRWKVKAIEITGYGPAGAGYDHLPNARLIEGVAEINGEGEYPFWAVVADVDEPGRDKDYFELHAGPVEIAKTIDGGNIQFHGKACPK